MEDPRFIACDALIVKLGSLVGDFVLRFPAGARIVSICENGVASGVRGKYALPCQQNPCVIYRSLLTAVGLVLRRAWPNRSCLARGPQCIGVYYPIPVGRTVLSRLPPTSRSGKFLRSYDFETFKVSSKIVVAESGLFIKESGQVGVQAFR